LNGLWMFKNARVDSGSHLNLSYTINYRSRARQDLPPSTILRVKVNQLFCLRITQTFSLAQTLNLIY